MDGRILIVLNPISGGGRGLRLLPRVQAELGRRGVESDVFHTERAGDARRVAREKGGSYRGIVAMGGDGTINEIVNGLERTEDVALGAIPVGTANLLARELRLPRNPEQAAGIIAGDRTQQIDLCEANGRRFLMCAGVGWDAEVLRHLEAARRGPISFRTYLQPIAQAMMSYDFPEIRVIVDGEEIRGGILFVGNIRNYAGFFTVTPDAIFDDGLLDVCVIKKGRRRDFLRWFAAAYTGRLGRYKDVVLRQGREIRVESDRPLPFQVDGDCAGETPVTIRVKPRAARVMIREGNTP